MILTALFFAFAAILVIAALGVITTRNPVYSAMFLVLAFFTSAALWLLMEAEFLAIVLVLVYVGAVMVLFLFVVMMLDVNTERLREGFTRYAPLGGVIALIMALEIGQVFWLRARGTALSVVPSAGGQAGSNTHALGAVLYTEHVYAFELASVILLVAIVAAITLTMRRRPGMRVQNVSRQVAVRREDRVRVVKMDAEKD